MKPLPKEAFPSNNAYNRYLRLTNIAENEIRSMKPERTVYFRCKDCGYEQFKKVDNGNTFVWSEQHGNIRCLKTKEVLKCEMCKSENLKFI